jgi:SAM-dependent methyltransferase
MAGDGTGSLAGAAGSVVTVGFRYDYAFAWDLPCGRASKLVDSLKPPGGLVVDLGCGVGASREALEHLGFAYAGADVDPDAVATVQARGGEAAVIDLTDLDAADRGLSELVGDRDLAAVLLLDVLEHLARPDVLLGRLAEILPKFGEPLVVVSIPNVAHVDLAAKLLLGRWDITPSGLLDSTHVSLFTEARVCTMLSDAGFDEVGRDDLHAAANDQRKPPWLASLADGAPLGELVRSVRSGVDPYATAYQFVRAYRPSAARSRPEDADADHGAAIVVVGARDAEGADATLASIDSDGFDVSFVDGAGLAAALDEIVASTSRPWVSVLTAGDALTPALLTALADGPIGAQLLHDGRLDPLSLAVSDGSIVALPVGNVRALGIRFAADGVAAGVARLVNLCGAGASHEPLVRRRHGSDPLRTSVAHLDDLPFVLPVGSAGRLAGLLDEAASAGALREQVDAFERSRWWRLTAPGRRATAAMRRRVAPR